MMYEVGMLCKHFKGHDLLEKNIYRIEELGVKGSDIDETTITYSGDHDLKTATNLVVYSNIFQEGKKFCREYEDISGELSSEKQLEFGQIHKVEPLKEEEIIKVTDPEFIKEKQAAVEKKFIKK